MIALQYFKKNVAIRYKTFYNSTVNYTHKKSNSNNKTKKIQYVIGYKINVNNIVVLKINRIIVVKTCPETLFSQLIYKAPEQIP